MDYGSGKEAMDARVNTCATYPDKLSHKVTTERNPSGTLILPFAKSFTLYPLLLHLSTLSSILLGGGGVIRTGPGGYKGEGEWTRPL